MILLLGVLLAVARTSSVATSSAAAPCTSTQAYSLPAEAAVTTGDGLQPLVVFRGNLAIVDEVYRTILDLRPGTRATPQTAAHVERRLNEFLHRAGYDLARVEVRLAGAQIVADIDEGRLDKVVILGEGAFRTLQIRLELNLPYNIFNRPELDRQLRALAAKYHFRDYHYEIVPVEQHPVTALPPLTMDLLRQIPFLPPGEPYELHILIERYSWQTGLSPELYTNSLDGLAIGADYRNRDLLLPGDRWDASGRVAGTIRERLDRSKTTPVFSRGTLEGRWYTPPFFGEDLRSFLSLRQDYRNRQREDLQLEGFGYLLLQATLNVSYTFFSALNVSLGAGVEHRELFGIQAGGDESPLVAGTPRHQTLPFEVLSGSVIFNGEELRRDRAHQINLEGRLYQPAASDRSSTLQLFGDYQKTFLIDWHEIRLESHGALLVGDVLFAEEPSVGADTLRGPFARTYYARKYASLSGEWRFSIVRDLFKIGIYHDLVVFGGLDQSGNERLLAADAFGLGFHVLLLDTFQLDAYFGIGFSTEGGKFDDGIAIQIKQAY